MRWQSDRIATSDRGFTLTTVMLAFDAVRLFPSGSSQVCVGLRDGSAACYALATGEAPRRIDLPPDTIEVALSDYQSCALLRSGRVTCWGRLYVNRYWYVDPVPMPGADMGLSGMRHLVANDGIGCASQGAGGGTWCWGAPSGILLERVPIPDRVGLPPMRIEGFDDAVSLALSYRFSYDRFDDHLCAITSRFTVICRGSNRYGESSVGASGPVGRTLVWGVE